MIQEWGFVVAQDDRGGSSSSVCAERMANPESTLTHVSLRFYNIQRALSS
jgi:hypothetical protein